MELLHLKHNVPNYLLITYYFKTLCYFIYSNYIRVLRLLVDLRLGDILEANKIHIKTIAVDFGYHDKKTLKIGKPFRIISRIDEIDIKNLE